MVTPARPSLLEAARSVFRQDVAGRVQLVIGVDKLLGDRSVLAAVAAECPPHMAVTVVDPGYSTARNNGGLYASYGGGGLRTILSYLANSRHVAYLDDDNTYAPEHLSALLRAVDGRAWAYSYRWFVDKVSGDTLCRDTWESIGPGRGVYAPTYGGFVDTNCYLVDKIACHAALPEWCNAPWEGGTGEDRAFMKAVAGLPYRCSEAYSALYRIGLDGLHPYLLRQFREAGIDLARYMRTLTPELAATIDGMQPVPPQYLAASPATPKPAPVTFGGVAVGFKLSR
jgi:hypothetical protein